MELKRVQSSGLKWKMHEPQFGFNCSGYLLFGALATACPTEKNQNDSRHLSVLSQKRSPSFDE
uniref:Uncharacterized protein n=1 Tax=Rhizophora mucronata TaxID=61149 RepID=A0A2P2IYD3_RHIMU